MLPPTIIGPRSIYWDNFLSSLKLFTLNYFNIKNKNHIIYNEIGFHYNELPNYNRNIEILINGYFQSYKYFENYFNDIKKIINLDSIKENIKNKYNNIIINNSISIHFRLGDYKNIQNFHPILNREYYDKCLQYIIDNDNNDNIKKYTVLFFCESEDNDTVFNHIEYFRNKYSLIDFIKVDDSILDWEQLIIISLCNHNIIANSSYSWWGAYINDNKEKIVCYPSIWFGPELEKNNTNDLFPNNWIKIN